VSVLERESSGFSRVRQEWIGVTAAILGGGPSLTQDQVAQVQHSCRVVAVNDAYLLAPWADVCYFADSIWWEWQIEGHAKPLLDLSGAEVRERFKNFEGQLCSIQYAGSNIRDERVHMMREQMKDPNTLSDDPTRLVTGRNSGFQAMNLAILAGASRILLLGFDNHIDHVTGRSHWFGEHPRPRTHPLFYDFMRRSFSAAEHAIKEAGVEVINCTPGSTLDSFPKREIEEALA
jgi:hypothetical protein